MKHPFNFILLTVLLASVVSQAQTKYVVIEEGTGTWCSACPGAIGKMRAIKKDYPNLIGIEIHNGDPMENQEYDNASGFMGRPSSHVNRKYINYNHSSWENVLPTEFADTPPADIDLAYNYNSNTRELIVTVEGTFYENLNDEHRFAAIVVENGITGPSPAYDQRNLFSGGDVGPAYGFEYLPNPVPAGMMVYNNVAREILGGYDGEAGSLTATIASGQVLSHDFTIVLDQEYDENMIYVVGLLIETASGEIRNAGKGTYINGSDNGAPFFHSEALTAGVVGSEYTYEVVTHDPEDDDRTLTGINLPSWVNLQSSTNEFGTLIGIPDAAGTFDVTLEVNDGQEVATQTFQIVVEESTEGWIQVGDVGFGKDAADRIDLEFNSEGVPHVMYANSSNNRISIEKFENNSWSQVGNNIDTESGWQGEASFSIGPDNAMYVNDGRGKVYAWDGTGWSLMGSFTSSAGYGSDVIGAENGEVYYSFGQRMHHFDGSEWTMLRVFSVRPAARHVIQLNGDGLPIVAYENESPGQGYPRVSVYDGLNWELLGGSDILDERVFLAKDIAIADNGDVYHAGVYGSGEQKLKVHVFHDGSWKEISENLPLAGSGTCNLELDQDGNLFLGFIDLESASRYSVMKYDGQDWKYFGTRGFTPSVGGSCELKLGENQWPYVAYPDVNYENSISVKQYVDFNVGIDFIHDDHAANSTRIHVFPNPGDGLFTLFTSEQGLLQVYDGLGRQVKSIELNQADNSEMHRIDLSHLSPGMYHGVLASDSEIIYTSPIFIR